LPKRTNTKTGYTTKRGKMKQKRKTQKPQSSEKSRQKQLAKQIQQLLDERGADTLKNVQGAILEEKIESPEIQEALKYFLSCRRGFLVRPMLISLGCEAVGGRTDLIPEVATPLVLMSGGMDIHDDIIDNQKTQESRPTVFGKFNRDVALLTGDALLFKGLISWHRLADRRLPIRTFMKMTQMLDEAFFEVGDGEALELTFERRLDIDPTQYLHVVGKKAADIGVLLQIGAMLGKGSQDQIEALGKYGRSLGTLWVLSDDIVDIFDFSEMKRRISKGCLPLPLICAAKDPKAKLRIETILSRKPMSGRDHKRLMRVILDAEGLELIKRTMKNLAEKAMKEIENVYINSKLKLLLRASLEVISQI